MDFIEIAILQNHKLQMFAIIFPGARARRTESQLLPRVLSFHRLVYLICAFNMWGGFDCISQQRRFL